MGKMIAEDQLRAQMMALLPRLRRFALALTSRPSEADDLVQDTVERALRNLNQFVPDTRMDSWMFRIAQNLWIDRLRANKVRAGTVNDLTEAENLAFDGERAAEAHSMLAATMRALKELPQEQREVVALVLIDGISYREAAAILELPIGTVTSRLARAREALAVRVLGTGTLRENALQ
jgi:RNA polymerase sigma-70 factor (ECF subfamily)